MAALPQAVLTADHRRQKPGGNRGNVAAYSDPPTLPDRIRPAVELSGIRHGPPLSMFLISAESIPLHVEDASIIIEV